jgi:hypothetical protein
MTITRRLIHMLAALVVAVILRGAEPASAQATAEQGCRGNLGSPSREQLQGWVRDYYPGFLTQTKTSGKVVIGFVVDSLCNVRRHGAAFQPDSAIAEGLITTVFPDVAVRDGKVVGIEVRRLAPDDSGKPEQYALKVAFLVQR